MAALRSGRNWLAAISGAAHLPVALYLITASDTIAANLPFVHANFWLMLPLAILIQLPQLFIILGRWSLTPTADRGLLLVSMGVLLLTPFYNFGPVSDFTPRVSAPFIAVVTLSFANVFSQLDRVRDRTIRLAALMIIGISFFPPGFELMRPLMRHRFAISNCTLMQASIGIDSIVDPNAPLAAPSNYVAPVERIPAWIMEVASMTPIAFAARACWPDHPLLHPPP